MRALRTAIATITLTATMLLTVHAQAAYQEGTGRDDVIVGADDDNRDDPEIQPAGVTAQQSLDNADVQVGLRGDDVLIGLRGADMQLGGPGNDIFIGGTEGGLSQRGGPTPNGDIQIGDSGNDISLWRGGDGSDLFDGGDGPRDTLVFGNIDRDADNIPVLSPVVGRHETTGLPTADVTGQGGFCTLEAVQYPEARGFEFLVRFFSRATGALLVTVRTRQVEQVFCTSEAGGAITFADLTESKPDFDEIPLGSVPGLNPTVAQMIR
jgi:hypothetical protein